MPLNKERLKGRIKAAFNEMQDLAPDSDAGLEMLCQSIATAVVDEVKEITIQYQSGLASPSGVVTGSFNYSIS